MKITRQQTSLLKGVAILFMLFHHLFFFQERLSPSVIVYYPFFHGSIENTLAGFGRVCVPIFLFLSGYGFGMGKPRGYGGLAKKALEVYSRFWLVFVLFVPLGAILFNQTGRYDLSMPGLLLNITALDTSYNPEWWFLILYVAYLFSLTLLQKMNDFTLLFSSVVLMVVGTLLYKPEYNWLLRDGLWYCIWLFPFAAGLVCARKRDLIHHWLSVSTLCKSAFIFCSLLAVPLVYTLLMHRGYRNIGLCLVTPLLVYLLAWGLRLLPAIVQSVISDLGQHSTFMWLTHTFYCYYFFQSWIYSPHYPLLIFALLIAVSWLTSVVLSRIYNVLFNRPVVPRKPASL